MQLFLPFHGRFGEKLTVRWRAHFLPFLLAAIERP